MAENPIEKANAAFMSGDFKTALDNWTASLESVGSEHHYALHTNRGAALERLGRIEDAIKAYDEALTSKPDHVEALHNRGVALKALKRYPEALESFERALSFNPDFYPSLRGRTDALTTLERYDEAIASATAAIKVKSDDPSPYADRAFAELKCRKLEDAVTDYDKARSLGDESHETKRLQAIALSQRAVELDKEGDLVRAEKYYDQAIEFEGTESRLFNRAFLYMRTGRTDKAIEGYKQVTAMAPQNFQARAALGTLLLQRENFAEAIPVLKEASALQPGAADITFNLGFAYLREDELDQAEAQFKRALEIDPKMENAKNGLEAVEAARGHGKFSVQVGGAVEIPAAGGSAELAAKLTEKRQAAASAGSSAADAGAAASSSPAAAVAAPPPAAAGGAGASPKPSTAAPPARAAATSPEASTTAAPAASAASSATPSGLSIPSMKPKRDVRMSVAPQLLGALSASVSTGPLTAMAQPTSTEDPDAKFQLDEDGVGGVSHPYEKLRAPGPYPDGVDAGHRESYLSREDFKRVFGMDKPSFFKAPKWKRVELRKKVGLF